jgi:dolichol-phosphate mannosyltransferase
MNLKPKGKALDFSSLAVVIPCYQEAENLKILLPKIKKSAPGARVVIVDDSPFSKIEETKEAVRSISGLEVELIFRQSKGGRGSAVIAGLKSLVSNSKILYAIEMDADLAHDPAEIPDFLQVAAKFDMVVGSRYTSRSRIVNWPWYRLFQSRIINFCLRYLLGVNLTDYTNGFRLYSHRAFAYLVSHPPKESGFIALSEIAYELKKQGFMIGEIPITFTDRVYGRSNAGIAELFRSLAGVIKIRFLKPS